MKYIVTSPSERTIEVEAKNATEAKYEACKIWGICPGDKWCGVSVMKAKMVKTEYEEDHHTEVCNV